MTYGKTFSCTMEAEKTRQYRGSVFGLQHSCVVYQALVTTSLPLCTDTLVSYLSSIVSFDKSKIHNFTDPNALVEFILLMTKHIQNECKIPLFEAGKILESHQADTSQYKIQFAQSYMLFYPSQITLIFVLEVVHAILNQSMNFELLTNKYYQLQSELRKFAHQGINQMRFLQAAKNLELPFRKYLENIYIFGNGVNSRFLESTLTDKTSKIGTHIASNKYLTNQLLKSFGLPVPKQIVISNISNALTAAQTIGYPVVLKPSDLEGGTGVFAGIKDEKTLREVYEESIKYSKNLLVEKHIFGKDYRITVFQDKVIKTILRVPGGVYGDGVQTIKSLLMKSQTNPQIARRSKEKGYPILTLDSEAKSLLSENNMDESYIPKPDEFVPLRRKANAYTGGLTHFVAPEKVHPDNISLAIRIAKALKIDILGVDLIIEDISMSYLDTQCGICEVNAQPQIGNSDTPHIYEEILSQLVPNKGHIPIIVTFGMDEDILTFPNLHVGKFANNTSSIDKQIIAKNISFFDAVQSLINSDDVELLLAHSCKSEDFSQGFPFFKCDFLIVAHHEKALEKFFDNAVNIITTKEIVEKIDTKKYNANFTLFQSKEELQEFILNKLKLERK